MDRILTTSNICVNEIHSLRGGDLEIVSGNKVLFNTPNLLIGNMLFDNYCTNIVFTNTLIAPDENYYKVTIGDISNRDEITNMSEYELMSVDCTQVTSKETYEKISGENKENYINLTGENNIYIKSSNIFVNDESFHDYVYRKVNNKEIPSHNSIFVTKTAVHQGMIDTSLRVADVTNMGTFVTKKILCDKISTENIYVSGDIEPILKISSDSGINFGLSSSDEYHNRIFIIEDDENIVNLDTYLKRRLDESSMFEINILAEPGVDITISYDQNIESKGFSNYYNNISEFSYDINFKIVLNGEIPDIDSEIGLYDEYHAPQIGSAINIQDDQLTENISFGNTTYSRYALSNLTAGQFYDVYADIKNNFTGTIVYNVLTNAVNVPTIEHVVINSIDIINERTLEISFIPHVTVVPSWFTQEKLVFFYLKLYDHDDSVNLYTSCNYDISSSGSRPIYTYRFDINEFDKYFDEYGLESYENIIKVEKENPSTTYENINYIIKEHRFSIVSVHGNDAMSTFEMISIPIVNAPHLRDENPEIVINPPLEPTNLEIKYFNKIAGDYFFEWTPPNSNNFRTEIINEPTESRISEIFYEIFRDGTLLTIDEHLINTWYDGENILQNNNLNIDNINRNVRKGIIEGEYTIYAYNKFGKHFKERDESYQRSIALVKTVHPLTIDNIRFVPIEGVNKEWMVSYDILNSNSDFVIDTNHTNLGLNTNITSYIITLSSFNEYNIWIQATDDLMQIRSENIVQTIAEPMLNIGIPEYVSGTERHYQYTITLNHSFDNSINNNNVNTHNNLIEDLFNLNSVTNMITLETIETKYRLASINVQFKVNNSINDIITQFKVSARDSYGYESQNTLSTNLIEVSFNDLTIKPVLSVSENKYFSLNFGGYEYSDQFTNFIFRIDNVQRINSSSSTASLDDNDNYFGDIDCIITQTNNKGFSRNGLDSFIDSTYLISTVKNDNNVVNPDSVFSTFTLNSPASLNNSFTYTLSYSHLNPDILANIQRRIVNPSNSVSNIGTSYDYQFKYAGEYKLELFLKNKYGFRSWVRLRQTVTVDIPTDPTFTISKTTSDGYKKITIIYNTNNDSDGDPQETPIRSLEYSPDNGSPLPSQIIINSGINNIDITSLTSGTHYSITIRKNYTVYDNKLTTLEIYTNKKPEAPTLRCTKISYTEITIEYSKNNDGQEYDSDSGWKNISGNTPTSVLLKLQDRSDSSQNETINITLTTNTKYEFTNLSVGNTYDFIIEKIYTNNEFDISNSLPGISTLSIEHAVNPSISFITSSYNSITLQFIENGNGSAGSSVTYKLYRKNSTDSVWIKLDDNFTPTISWTDDTNIQVDTQYNYKLEKYIPEPFLGYGQNESTSGILEFVFNDESCRSLQLIYPEEPELINSPLNTYTSITVNYNLGNNGTPTVIPTTIKIYYSNSQFNELSVNTLQYKSIENNSNSTEITGLVYNSSYYFMIEKNYGSPYNRKIYSELSLDFSTNSYTVPSIPVIHDIDHISSPSIVYSKSINVVWSGGTAGSATLITYSIYRDDSLVESNINYDSTNNVYSYLIENLEVDQTYNIKIEKVDSIKEQYLSSQHLFIQSVTQNFTTLYYLESSIGWFPMISYNNYVTYTTIHKGNYGNHLNHPEFDIYVWNVPFVNDGDGILNYQGGELFTFYDVDRQETIIDPTGARHGWVFGDFNNLNSSIYPKNIMYPVYEHGEYRDLHNGVERYEYLYPVTLYREDLVYGSGINYPPAEIVRHNFDTIVETMDRSSPKWGPTTSPPPWRSGLFTFSETDTRTLTPDWFLEVQRNIKNVQFPFNVYFDKHPLDSSCFVMRVQTQSSVLYPKINNQDFRNIRRSRRNVEYVSTLDPSSDDFKLKIKPSGFIGLKTRGTKIFFVKCAEYDEPDYTIGAIVRRKYAMHLSDGVAYTGSYYYDGSYTRVMHFRQFPYGLEETTNVTYTGDTAENIRISDINDESETFAYLWSPDHGMMETADLPD